MYTWPAAANMNRNFDLLIQAPAHLHSPFRNLQYTAEGASKTFCPHNTYATSHQSFFSILHQFRASHFQYIHTHL